jgi:transcriptional regulator with XRE-family HTH domain
LHTVAVTVSSTVTSDSCFGARLRRERERRQISLASIAANTKISASLLEGLERDDLARWPHGIFRRSFVRDYATAVGLDPDETIREFLIRFPDPDASPETPPAAAAGPLPVAATSASSGDTALRLTLGDTSGTFAHGPFLPAARQRCAAAACDLAVVAILGLISFEVVGSFWLPVAVWMTGYYAGGILLLGNTPGVCLFAPNTSVSPRHPPAATGNGPTILTECDEDWSGSAVLGS